jgi:hypothetical protein
MKLILNIREIFFKAFNVTAHLLRILATRVLPYNPGQDTDRKREEKNQRRNIEFKNFFRTDLQSYLLD